MAFWPDVSELALRLISQKRDAGYSRFIQCKSWSADRAVSLADACKRERAPQPCPRARMTEVMPSCACETLSKREREKRTEEAIKQASHTALVYST